MARQHGKVRTALQALRAEGALRHLTSYTATGKLKSVSKAEIEALYPLLPTAEVNKLHEMVQEAANAARKVGEGAWEARFLRVLAPRVSSQPRQWRFHFKVTWFQPWSGRAGEFGATLETSKPEAIEDLAASMLQKIEATMPFVDMSPPSPGDQRPRIDLELLGVTRKN